MKWLFTVLTIMLVVLQFRLWLGDGSLEDIANLERSIDRQQALNDQARERNRQLELEISQLKNGLSGIEALAREDMGMIKPGETFYLVVKAPR